MLVNRWRNWSLNQKRTAILLLSVMVVLAVAFLMYFNQSSPNPQENVAANQETVNNSTESYGQDKSAKSSGSAANEATTDQPAPVDSVDSSATAPAAPAPSSSSTPPPSQPTMSTVSSSVSVSPLTVGSTTARCPAGTKVVAGGFHATEEAILLRASYMVSGGWFVKATNRTTSAITINSYAQCLTGLSGTMQTLTNSTTIADSASGTINKDCPTGETVMSGGFDSMQNNLNITFSAKVDNGWRANSVQTNGSAQTLKVLTNYYVGGVSVTQLLETASVPAGWTWTKEKACSSGLTMMGGFASSAHAFSSFFMTSNSKWKTAVFNTTSAPVNFKAYTYCTEFS